jgi:2-succinyl-5-enolpyruvyl-6-hydroxy-3-cyclohexene-1-carboxylate synthase
MKKYINRNYFWASLFAKQLEVLGIKDVCISPGSRNTPLTLAFAANKKFKKYIHTDERSSGFFALGLAKKKQKPVVIVTTSGTAVTELYPAITEAYQQRIPLIVCTADRPSHLRNTGANQTVNQENIFKNHIRKFIDVGLPELSKNKLRLFSKKTVETVSVAAGKNKGPVHINFPFEKPLEPNSFTDEIVYEFSDFIFIPNDSVKKGNYSFEGLNFNILNYKNIIIHLAWDNFDKEFYGKLLKFSKQSNIPVFADGTSELRFLKKSENIIVNHSAFLKNENIRKKIKPDLILQFGNAPTSQTMLEFFQEVKIITVNEFGDKKNASRKKCKIIKAKPTSFLDALLQNRKKFFSDKKRFNEIVKFDKIAETVKQNTINKSAFKLEPRIVNELLNLIPSKSNLFISNSMPVRDYDFFASKNSKQIKIFTNRGASGIDGIISTASGIAVQSKQKTFLVIGDLAFYHNLSALSTLSELKIPLIILLINNNGGGIFNMLPVADCSNNFEKYFITSQNLNYMKITKAFNGNYFSPKNWNEFEKMFRKAVNKKTYSVIEFKTDSKKSLQLRKKYWLKVKQTVERNDN